MALNFAACATEACIDIPMVNDDTAEYVEDFKISLELSSEKDQWIQLVSVTTDITITDDDGMNDTYFHININCHIVKLCPDMLVGFSSSAYTTTETVGEVSVCVGVTNSFNGKALRPLTVAILPDESNALRIIARDNFFEHTHSKPSLLALVTETSIHINCFVFMSFP